MSVGYVYTIWIGKPPSPSFTPRECKQYGSYDQRYGYYTQEAKERVQHYGTQLNNSLGPNGIGFYAGQLEKCPETERLHFQLYVEYSKRSRGTRIEKILGIEKKGYYCELRKGTAIEAREYCSKDDTAVGPTRVTGTVLSNTLVDEL